MKRKPLEIGASEKTSSSAEESDPGTPSGGYSGSPASDDAGGRREEGERAIINRADTKLKAKTHGLRRVFRMSVVLLFCFFAGEEIFGNGCCRVLATGRGWPRGGGVGEGIHRATSFRGCFSSNCHLE